MLSLLLLLAPLFLTPLPVKQLPSKTKPLMLQLVTLPAPMLLMSSLVSVLHGPWPPSIMKLREPKEDSQLNRRNPAIGGELGGPKAAKTATSALFVFLWV